MADRTVENYTGEIPPMPEVLQRLIIEALDEGKRHLEDHGALVPFTMLVVGNSLFTEAAEGNNPKECFNVARHTVEGARGASAYAFCYDGYLDTDEGTKDAIIAEGGVPGGETAFALGYLYEPASTPDGKPKFGTNPSYIGTAPNFMEGLTDASEYAMTDEGKQINTINDGEKEERDNAKSFGEPLKATDDKGQPINTIGDGEKEEYENAKDFGEPLN